jgi:hypothetical protein
LDIEAIVGNEDEGKEEEEEEEEEEEAELSTCCLVGRYLSLKVSR